MDQGLQIVAAVNDSLFESAEDFRHALDLANVTARSGGGKQQTEAASPLRNPLLTRANKTARLKFAVDHRSWTVGDSKYVVFSDESTFCSRWDREKRV
ncbi:hypothetical protein HPB50_021423 [Hyalomma asiaticum]|uniref:Uncharacterized protein n=1 Tax=Hyalomma asiaticum TaxID=266040 RepID=A0ACB7SJS5_HYAAI|nr:hypothetical protein HPB50_021423 [Hyalomma asiaticum]